MSVNHPVKTPDSRETAMSFERTMSGTRSGRSEANSSRKRLSAIAMAAVVAALVGVAALSPSPVSAHGGTDEVSAVDLVEQALAIVVNSPDATGDALERIGAALAEEAEEPTGALDIASLELASISLETGDLHGAEDALVAALGIDPHATGGEPAETGEESTSISIPEAAADTSAGAGVGPDATQSSDTEKPDDVDGPVGTVAALPDAASHGLTDRVDGGFRAPSGTGIAALALAGVFAVGGFALAYSRTGGK